MAFLDLLDKERTIAGPTFNRWLVPPAALAIHLCIGMAYGFSVFWLPLSRALGVSGPALCERTVLLQAMMGTQSAGRVSDLLRICSILFVVLGTATAFRFGLL